MIIPILIAINIIVWGGAILLLRSQARKHRSTPSSQAKYRRKNVDLGDLDGVEVTSTPAGTTIKKGGRVVYSTDARGVQIDTRNGGKIVNEIR